MVYNALIVEDTWEWRTKLADYLIEEGEYNVFEAADYKTATKLLQEQPFDVVTVDLRLVDWDQTDEEGMKLLEEIAEIGQGNGTQAIVITGYGTMERMHRAFRDHQVFDFIGKMDFDPREFKENVRKAAEKAYEIRSEIFDRQHSR
jgi:DNA-binding NtrC family response regulator